MWFRLAHCRCWSIPTLLTSSRYQPAFVFAPIFMKFIDLTNKRFGKWTAIRYERVGARGKWFCRCSCGTERLIWANDLKTHRTTNCGCVRRTHGMTNSREFETWHSMCKRCTRKKEANYHRYGGRGICVCKRWLKFANFYADMGPKPQGTELDRIDNDGPYSPENCRWASRAQNANNRGNNRRITHNGVTKTLAEWSAALGGNNYLVGMRLKQGWPISEAVTLRPSRTSRTSRHPC
jgi:hypothetical protein